MLAVIGDGQEIRQNLSTFASHLTRVREVLERASLETLVLLDELGGGTDPEEGAALSYALLERLLFRELFEFRVMQTDPNFANYLYQPASGRVVLLDFGATKRFEAAFVANYARITRAVIDGDRTAVAREAVRIGYLPAHASPESGQAVVDVMAADERRVDRVGRVVGLEKAIEPRGDGSWHRQESTRGNGQGVGGGEQGVGSAAARWGVPARRYGS